jgi:nitrate reductase / nitrite oxidoreductase, beta subunit
VEYLAELFTAGDTARVTGVLRRLGAMRSYMRDINLGRPPQEAIAASVGMTGRDVLDMHRLLAVAKYDERYVIPTAHAEQGPEREEPDIGCSLDYAGGPGMGGWGPFGETSGGATPIAVENFHMLARRQLSDTPAAPPTRAQRVNPAELGRQGGPGRAVPAAGGCRAATRNKRRRRDCGR